MGRMRYEMMESDGDYNEMYQDRYQENAFRKRYAGSRPTLCEQQDSLRAKNIKVFTNGTYDQVKIVYSKKRCRTLESLFKEIVTAKSRFSKMRVDDLYKWPSGDKVSSLADIEENGQTVFVCSDKKNRLNTKLRYDDIGYGESESGSSRNSRDAYRSEKPSPTSTRSQRSPLRGMNSRPITINVISNTHRNSRQSVFFNPKRPFDDLLKDISEMLEMSQPPCTALYTTRYPHQKADSNSSFKRIVLHNRVDQFYAVGQEGEVLSSQGRDVSPMRNGHGRSQKSKNGYQQNGYQQNGYHSGESMSNGYDRQNGYEDNGGRTYRRHQDSGERHRPDGNDYDAYSPEDDRNDRQRRDSPGRQVSHRRDWKQEEESVTSRHESNDRSRYETYEERRKTYGNKRQESDDRRNDKRQYDRNDRDRDSRKRDDSHDRNHDTRRFGNTTDRRRDDSPERGRDTKRRDESRNRDDDDRKSYRGGRKSPDDDGNLSRGISPTDSEMNTRIVDVDGDGKADLDKSVEY